MTDRVPGSGARIWLRLAAGIVLAAALSPVAAQGPTPSDPAQGVVRLDVTVRALRVELRRVRREAGQLRKDLESQRKVAEETRRRREADLAEVQRIQVGQSWLTGLASGALAVAVLALIVSALRKNEPAGSSSEAQPPVVTGALGERIRVVDSRLAALERDDSNTGVPG